MAQSRIGRGMLLAVTLTGVSACAQGPGSLLGPVDDGCDLLCTVNRTLGGRPAPAPTVPAPVLQPTPRSQQPGPHHRRLPTRIRPTLAPATPQSSPAVDKVKPEAPPAAVQPPPEVQPPPGSAGLAPLPGSAPIPSVTTHFVPAPAQP